MSIRRWMKASATAVALTAVLVWALHTQRDAIAEGVAGWAAQEGDPALWEIPGKAGQNLMATSTRWYLPIVPANQNTRILVSNETARTAWIAITGFDDAGERFGPRTLTLDASRSVRLGMDDIERGNAEKGFPTGIGDEGAGWWRLVLSGTAPFFAAALTRAPDGHVTSLGEARPLPAPNLTAESAWASTTQLQAGASFSLHARAYNQGEAASDATRMHWYLSTDDTISAEDTAVSESTWLPGLTPHQWKEVAVNISAPTAPGTYWYGACVGVVVGEARPGDNCSGAVRIVVTEPPREFYGAIAYGWAGQYCEDSYFWHYWTDRQDGNAALQRVLSDCRSESHDGTCEGFIFRNCGSLAYGETATRCGIRGGIGATRQAAEQDALGNCRSDGFSDCSIPIGSSSGRRATYCNSSAASGLEKAAEQMQRPEAAISYPDHGGTPRVRRPGPPAGG